MLSAAHAAVPPALKPAHRTSYAADAAAARSDGPMRHGACGGASGGAETPNLGVNAGAEARAEPPSGDASADLDADARAFGSDGAAGSASDDDDDGASDPSDSEDARSSLPPLSMSLPLPPGVPLAQRGAAARATAALTTVPRATLSRQAADALIGRRVRKHFGALGWFSGRVVSWRTLDKTRFFLVEYEDDDREELERRALLPILLPEGGAPPPPAQRADEKDDEAAEEAEEVPLADADEAEFALLEAVAALAANERMAYKRAVTEYAFGRLPDAVRAAARSSAKLDATLERAVARGWLACDGKLYETTDEGDAALEAWKARGSAAAPVNAAGACELSAAERVKLLKRSPVAAAPAPRLTGSRGPRVRKPDPRRIRNSSAAAPSSPPPKDLFVGRRVREPVTSTRFREGVVAARDAASGTYTIRYDDPALPLRPGVPLAELRAVALPKGTKPASRVVELPPHPVVHSGSRNRGGSKKPAAAPPKAPPRDAGAKAEADKKRRRSGSDAPQACPPAKGAKAAKGSPAAAPPGSVEAFLRAIDPPLSQLEASLALVPSSGVTAVHLLRVATLSGDMKALYVAELMRQLGVTAGADKLGFMHQLALMAQQQQA